MISAMKKAWLLWIILGGVIFGFGLTMVILWFLNGSIAIDFGNNHVLDLMKLVSGLLLILLAVSFVLPSVKHANSGFKILFAVEFTLILVVAVFGFILPFIFDLINNTGGGLPFNLTVTQWFGLVFWIHGAIHLARTAFSNVKKKGFVFVFGLFIVSFGVYFFFNTPNIETVQIIVAFLVTMIGAVILGISIIGLTERKQTKKVKA